MDWGCHTEMYRAWFQENIAGGQQEGQPKGERGAFAFWMPCKKKANIMRFPFFHHALSSGRRRERRLTLLICL